MNESSNSEDGRIKGCYILNGNNFGALEITFESNDQFAAFTIRWL